MVTLLTHHLLSLGVTALIVGHIAGGGVWIPWISWILAFGSAWVTDLAIDSLGHRRRGYWSQRIPLTHSVLTAPSWGFLTGIITGILTCTTFTILNLPIQINLQESIKLGITGGITAAFSHLLADSLTMGGVFVSNSARWRLAGLQNSSPTVNIPLALVGLAALGLGFKLFPAQQLTPIVLLALLALATRVAVWQYGHRKSGDFRRDYT